MDCEICFDKFDNTEHKPMSLLKCAHTICNKCYLSLPTNSKCPNCQAVIENAKPNWTLLNLLPTSECAKSEQDLCNVCLEKFDHSLRKPLTLIKCAHTLCSLCIKNLDPIVDSEHPDEEDIKQCPTCKEIIEETKTNWSVLKQTAPSQYDQLKQSIHLSIKQLDELEKKLDVEVKQTGINKLNETVRVVKKKVEDKTNEIIKILNENKTKTFKHIDSLAKDLKKELNSNGIVNLSGGIIDELNENKMTLEELIDENSRLSKAKADFSYAITIMMTQLNETIEFYPSEANPVNDLIGRVKRFNLYNSYQDKAKMAKSDEEAIKLHNQSIELNPKIWMAYYEKAKIYYFNKRNFKLALAMYLKVAEIDPFNVSFQINLADCYSNLEMHNEAIKCCDRALEIDSMLKQKLTERAFYLKAYSLSRMDYHEEAVEWYAKAIAKDPTNWYHYFNIGNSLSALEKHDKAIEYLDKSIQLQPTHSRSFCAKGQCLAALDRYREAANEFIKALKLEPKNEEYKMNLDQVTFILKNPNADIKKLTFNKVNRKKRS